MPDAGTPDLPAPVARTKPAAVVRPGELPRLQDLLAPQPDQPARAGPVGTQEAYKTDVPSFEIATPADRKELIDALKVASREARRAVSGQAGSAAALVDQRAKKAEDQVGDEVKRANDTVKEMIAKRRIALDRTLRATQSNINWQKGLCLQAAKDRGEETKRLITKKFLFRLGRINVKTEYWVGRVEKIRDFRVKALHDDTEDRVKATATYASNYYKWYIVPRNRGKPEVEAVSRTASDAVAKAVGENFRKSAKKVTDGFATTSSPNITEIRYQSSQVVLKYLAGLHSVAQPGR